MRKEGRRKNYIISRETQTTSQTDEKRLPVELDMDHLLMVLLLLWSSGLRAEGKNTSTGAQCESSAKTDIVLVLDGSGSMDTSDFQRALSFITKIVSAFDIGPDRVQIALVQYSIKPKTHWYLNTHQNKQALLEDVSRIQQLRSATYTGRALNYILQNIFQPNEGMRADSEKTVLLITDGRSSDDVDSPSQKLKDAGVEVYTVGFYEASERQLMSIASDPDENHVFIVKDSHLLGDIVDNLTINLCDGIKSSERVRLVGGSSRCAGALEVKRGEWRPVFGSNWTLMSADVMCKELDCGSAASTGWRSESSNRAAWQISPDCVESGSALRECLSPGSSSSIIKITCSEPVRLVGGSSRCAGALELKQGDWRPVYDSSWTLTSAAVVCRELHCGSVVSTGLRNESTLTSAWEKRPDCGQSGSALRECVSPMWSSFFLEVTCSGPTVSYIRPVILVLLSLALLLFITALSIPHQTTRGQKPGPQESTELDDYNLGVHRAGEEGGEAAE